MPEATKTAVDLTFRAFSDPVRLRLLSLLQNDELCVCDLVEVLELPQPTVSRHLAYLRRAGLVQMRQDGPWNYYRLAVPRRAFQEKLWQCLGACAAEVPELRSDAARVRLIQKRIGRCPP